MSSSAFTPSVLTIPASGSSGSGTGEISAITNGQAVTDTTGWTGATRVSSNSPLAPVISTAFEIANSATAESATSGAYATFTMPTGLRQRKLKVEFFFNTPATDSYRVSVYKGGVRVPLTTDSGGFSELPAGVTGGKYVGYFDTDGTTSWTVNVTRVTGSTGPCQFTNVIVGPGIQPQGAVVGEWQSYTPTVSGFGSGAATIGGRYRRVGSQMEVMISLTSITVAGTGTAGITFSIPSGHTIDFSKLPVNGVAGANQVGAAQTYGIAAATQYDALNPVYTVSTTTLGVLRPGTNTVIKGQDIPATLPEMGISASFPIAEWAGSGTVNLAQNDVSYLSHDGTNIVYGLQGSSVPNVGFATSYTTRLFTGLGIQSSEQLFLELNYQGNGWVPAESLFPWVQGNNANASNNYGTQMYWLSGQQLYVSFGNRGGAVSASNVDNGSSSWASEFSGGTRWRLRRASAGAAVGFGIVVPGTSSGLVSASGLPGNTTGNAIASGFVGEVLLGTGSSVSVSNSSPTSIASVAITAGRWLVRGQFTNNGVAGNAYVVVAISGATGSFTGTTEGYDKTVAVVNSSGVGDATITRVITISATTTYYLVAQFNAVVSACSGSIEAIRIA